MSKQRQLRPGKLLWSATDPGKARPELHSKSPMVLVALVEDVSLLKADSCATLLNMLSDIALLFGLICSAPDPGKHHVTAPNQGVLYASHEHYKHKHGSKATRVITSAVALVP